MRLGTSRRRLLAYRSTTEAAACQLAVGPVLLQYAEHDVRLVALADWRPCAGTNLAHRPWWPCAEASMFSVFMMPLICITQRYTYKSFPLFTTFYHFLQVQPMFFHCCIQTLPFHFYVLRIFFYLCQIEESVIPDCMQFFLFSCLRYKALTCAHAWLYRTVRGASKLKGKVMGQHLRRSSKMTEIHTNWRTLEIIIYAPFFPFAL